MSNPLLFGRRATLLFLLAVMLALIIAFVVAFRLTV